jgi:hypothetical protein
MLTTYPDWITPRSRLIADGMLSLRHKFVANNVDPSNATLILRRRMFVHRAAHTCSDTLEFQTFWTIPQHLECPVFVVNANGEGVCLQNGPTAPVVAFKSISGWQKIQQHDFAKPTRNDKCTTVGCAGGSSKPWLLYLPP